MKRRTKDKIQTATEALFDILSVGAVVTLTGLLSQGRGAPKMFRKFGAYSAWRIKQMLRRQKL